jgi:hypothetical protein
VDVYNQDFLNLAKVVGELSASQLDIFSPSGRVPGTHCRRLGAQSRSAGCREEKSFDPTGIRTLNPRPFSRITSAVVYMHLASLNESR